ncbi:VOC family protein [Prosthecobacter dejongeii]|uniref:PhnB protein n=1 Tax=Prosthecobacter dejongeii TaxID=48465 RepID=A0A7W8DPE2_9BACT|nr:VOC family protein [Prosthecobacter dejongeii]MBB5037055.1 PhnB protein [Prosthecobacter dejongeii]
MKTSLVQPYLFFGGRCEEALEFYRTAIGAQVGMVMRFSESPEPPPPDMLAPGFADKVMHASFTVGETVLMASDGCGGAESFAGFSLSLSVGTVEEAEAKFAALAEGGEVTMPLGKTFWSPCFGMLKDQFGMGWMVTLFEEAAPNP